MKKNGYSLVEIIVALGIFSMVIFSTIQVFITSREAGGISANKTKALFLINDYFESLKNLRRENWNNLINGRYLVTTPSGTIVLVPTTNGETIDDYTRFLTIENAFRDTTGKLVDSGGTQDPSTKKITVSVSWQGLHPAEIVQSSYLTRYLDNLSWGQTTEAEFNQGTMNSVAVVNNNGGEIILGGGGHGDWCNPGPAIIAQLDLPKNGVSLAIRAIEGRAFVGTGENASGVSLADINISNSSPPVPSIKGTVNGYKTNDVFIDGNFGYIGTDTNSKEFSIIDLTSYQEIGYFDAPGPDDASGIYVLGNVGYLITGSTLYTINLSSKIGNRSLALGSVSLSGTGKKLMVVGNYAYVTTTASSRELIIIDVSNPSSLSIVGWADVDGNQGQDVFVNQTGTRAYLITQASTTQKEFFIIDTLEKTGSRPIIGSYDTNGMNPTGVTVVTGNRAIVVGTSGEEYQVVNIGSETNLTRCGGLNIDSGINGVVGILEADGDAYSYIITSDTSSEFKIIEGGPGGQYSSSGYFESTTLDAEHQVAFNRFTVNFDAPSQTSVKFQVASLDPVGQTCQNVNFSSLDFVGPDGTSSTYFSEGGAIPLNDDNSGYENPGQCFRFRAYLETSEPSRTPTFYDFTVNYSP